MGEVIPLPDERQLLRMVQGAARAQGWLTYHTADSRGSDPGFPDLVLARGARLVFVELKAVGGKLSPMQAVWMAHLDLTEDVEAYTWAPGDWLDGTVAEVLA